MTTELEMSSTGNHRHFDEMIACSSLLSNAAHAYMNSSCQALLLNGDGMQDDAALSSLLHDNYNKLPYSYYESQHAFSNMEGISTLDYSRNNCTNVDSVSSNFNYYHSAYSEPFQMGGSREGLLDNILMGEPHISWATIPFNDNIKNNYNQPCVHLNSGLMDDMLMNDNYPLMSCLLSSSQESHSFNPLHNPHPLSLLGLNHMHTNVNSSIYLPLSVSQSSCNGRLEDIQQTLCQPVAAALAANSIVDGTAAHEQALFEDGQFQDGLFVSALFADGNKEELISEAYNLHGLQNSDPCEGQVGDDRGVLSSAFESSEGDKEAKAESLIKRETSPSSTSCFGDSSHLNTHHASSSLTGQYPANKRPLMEGDQRGPPRKRLTGMTSPARSDDVDEQEQILDDNNNNNNAAPSISNNTTTDNNNNVIDYNSKKLDHAEVDINAEEATPASPNGSVDKMDKSNIITTNTRTPKKSGTRGNNKPSTACDPQSIAARHRRERISERLKILQELVPNGSKVDIVTMLEKAINYVKFLQLQIKVLTTDEYWPNSQKLNQPNEMSLLNLIMSKAKNGSSSSTKSGKALNNTSKS